MAVAWPLSFLMNLYHYKYIRLPSEIGSTKDQLSIKIVAEYKLESFFVTSSRNKSLALMTMLFLHILTLAY